MKIYIPLERCGLGAQLMSIATVINYYSEDLDNVYILDNIRYKHPIYDYRYSSSLLKFFKFKDIKVITEPNSECLHYIYNNDVKRKEIYKGYLKFPNELVFMMDYIGANLELYKFPHTPISKNKTIVDMHKYNIYKERLLIDTLLNKIVFRGAFNNNLEDYTGYHFRCISDELYRFNSILFPLINLNGVNNRYIATDNMCIFKTIVQKESFNHTDILEYSNNRSNEDIYEYAKTEEIMIEEQEKSFNVAVNLASCKKFFGSKYSAFSNILVKLLIKLKEDKKNDM